MDKKRGDWELIYTQRRTGQVNVDGIDAEREFICQDIVCRLSKPNSTCFHSRVFQLRDTLEHMPIDTLNHVPQ